MELPVAAVAGLLPMGELVLWGKEEPIGVGGKRKERQRGEGRGTQALPCPRRNRPRPHVHHRNLPLHFYRGQYQAGRASTRCLLPRTKKNNETGCQLIIVKVPSFLCLKQCALLARCTDRARVFSLS